MMSILETLGFGDGSGDDVIISGEGEGGDTNFGDTVQGDGSGDDVIISGEGHDSNTGDTSFGMVQEMT